MGAAVAAVRRSVSTAVVLLLIVGASAVGLHDWADEHLQGPTSSALR